jgi:prepilin-type N-terminal cleavage/methylation domain-containing protein
VKTGEIMRGRQQENKGFTLIEMIAVLVIVAIIMAVAISRGIATGDVKLQAEVDTLKGHLRYAQYLAMNDIAPAKWGINVGGSSYTLIRFYANATTSPYSLPGESSATHSFAPITATPVTILFDDWGSPDNTSITLGGQTMTITANTGFIP